MNEIIPGGRGSNRRFHIERICGTGASGQNLIAASMKIFISHGHSFAVNPKSNKKGPELSQVQNLRQQVEITAMRRCPSQAARSALVPQLPLCS